MPEQSLMRTELALKSAFDFLAIWSTEHLIISTILCSWQFSKTPGVYSIENINLKSMTICKYRVFYSIEMIN